MSNLDSFIAYQLAIEGLAGSKRKEEGHTKRMTAAEDILDEQIGSGASRAVHSRYAYLFTKSTKEFDNE